MLVADHGLVMGQANGDVRTDHVPGHGQDRFPPLLHRKRPPQSKAMPGLAGRQVLMPS